MIEAARRLFNERSLPTQLGATALAAGLLAAGVATAASPAGAWPLAAAVAAGAGAAAVAAALLAWRTGRSLTAVADAAFELRRDDAPDTLELPRLDDSRETRLVSTNLRRMHEAARRRQRLLEERNAALERRLAARTHELSTLQDLSIGLATRSDVAGLVDEALGALGQTMAYTSASLWARSEREAGGHVVLLGYRAGPEGAPPDSSDLTGMRLSRANLQRYEQIERERAPLVENRARQSLLSWLWARVTDDARSSELYRASRSWTAVPLRYHDDVLGVMRVDHHEDDFFDAERVRLLSAVSSQTALAMRHARLQAQQREVAVAAERNRIARDLHDAVSQTLFAANVLAGTLAQGVERDPPLPPATLARQSRALERLNRGALAEMRLLMFELRPDALPKTPLAELLRHAIEALSCRSDIAIDAQLADDDAVPPEVRVQLYRIAQEALSNVARHSGARHCRVEWAVAAPGEATLRIRDDGSGFDTSQGKPGHFGLENMHSRAQEAGATLALTSTPGEGTEVLVTWKDPSA